MTCWIQGCSEKRLYCWIHFICLATSNNIKLDMQFINMHSKCMTLISILLKYTDVQKCGAGNPLNSMSLAPRVIFFVAHEGWNTVSDIGNNIWCLKLSQSNLFLAKNVNYCYDSLQISSDAFERSLCCITMHLQSAEICIKLKKINVKLMFSKNLWNVERFMLH